MASTTPKTIVLSGLGIRKEAIANATITPGHLIEKMSTGKVRVHATAGGNAQRMFAVEDDLQGNTISDDYAAASICQYNVMARGEEVLVIIADGQTIVIGDSLESAGDGTLKKHVPDVDDNDSADSTTIYTECIVAYAMEAIDLSDSSGADPAFSRIAAEVA